MFGRQIEGNHVAYWGARAIYDRGYYIDLLWDRQTTENVNEPFGEWINKRALPWLRKEVKRVGLDPSSREVLVFEDEPFRLEACPNASYGYLYIGAVQKFEEDKSCSKK